MNEGGIFFHSLIINLLESNMTKKTILTEKIKQFAKNNLSEQRIKTKASELVHSIAENKENKGLARLKRTMQWALQLLRLVTGVTISIFLIIALVLILVIPTLVLSLTFAMVCFPIFMLSAPFIWFFASKNNKNLTEYQKISDILENETALLCTPKEELADRKNISNANSNDIDAIESPLKIYSSFFDKKNSKLPDSQNQPASASIVSHSNFSPYSSNFKMLT